MKTTDEQVELLPCPFCGSPAEYKASSSFDYVSAKDAQESGLGYSSGCIQRESHKVFCTNPTRCYASMTGWSKESVFTLWNTRAPVAQSKVRSVSDADVETVCVRLFDGSDYNKHLRDAWRPTVRAALQNFAKGGEGHE